LIPAQIQNQMGREINHATRAENSYQRV